MKTQRCTLTVLGLLVVITTGSSIWLRQRLAAADVQIQALRSESIQRETLEKELARLRKIEVDQAELHRLRELQSRAARELPKLRDHAAQTIRAQSEATRLRNELAQATNAQGSNGIAAPMAEMMQGAMERSAEQRLLKMQERLNLSPDQVEGIRKIQQRKSRGISEAVRGVLSGKVDREKLAAVRDGHGDPELELRGLLSPEQQRAYETLVEDERIERASFSANNELVQMRHSLELRDDQVDPVFNVLYDQALDRDEGGVDGAEAPNPAERMRTLAERKLRSLESILSPSQITAYRQQQETQLKFAERLLGKSSQAAVGP